MLPTAPTASPIAVAELFKKIAATNTGTERRDIVEFQRVVEHASVFRHTKAEIYESVLPIAGEKSPAYLTLTEFAELLHSLYRRRMPQPLAPTRPRASLSLSANTDKTPKTDQSEALLLFESRRLLAQIPFSHRDELLPVIKPVAAQGQSVRGIRNVARLAVSTMPKPPTTPTERPSTAKLTHTVPVSMYSPLPPRRRASQGDVSDRRNSNSYLRPVALSAHRGRTAAAVKAGKIQLEDERFDTCSESLHSRYIVQPWWSRHREHIIAAVIEAQLHARHAASRIKVRRLQQQSQSVRAEPIAVIEVIAVEPIPIGAQVSDRVNSWVTKPSDGVSANLTTLLAILYH